MRILAALLGLLALSLAPAAAQNGRCSHENFAVGGSSVAVTVCAPASPGRSVPVSETFTHGSSSFNRTVTVERLPGADVSRAVDDASLTAFGVPYTLHLTLALRGAAVSIEHALLLPGAVPLK